MLRGIALLLSLVPGTASAQALTCRAPARVEVPRPDLPSADQPRRVLPIGGYTLAVTWNPGFCRANRNDPDNRFRCDPANRFGFTLHGLWPDGVGAQWPQYCTRAAIVPAAVIRQTLCATPSAQLIQHEYAKHGTCMGTTPQEYFARSTRLYGALRFPDMIALSRRPLTVGVLKAQIAAANLGLPKSAILVTLATRQGWLDELWLCFDTRLRYARCRAGTGGAADNARVQIWRGGR